MENKYYIPKREEFFEGFEYEAYIKDKDVWSKEVFYLNKSHLDLIKICDTRVKVLDKSDIEDLGFTILEETKLIIRAKLQRNITDFYSLTYYGGDSLYIDFHYPHTLNAETLTIVSKFGGTIKNKSELKRVLKMLNIL